MQLDIHSDYKDVVEAAQNTASQNLKQLVSRLTFTTDEGNFIHMDRSDLTSFEPMKGGTVLNKRNGSSEKVADTPEEVELMLNGTPSKTMMQAWVHSLQHIRSDEQSSIKRAVDERHSHLKNDRQGVYQACVNMAKKCIDDLDREKADLTTRDTEIKDHYKNLGWWAARKAGRDITKAADSEELKSISTRLSEIITEREGLDASFERFKAERDDEISAIDSAYEETFQQLGSHFGHQSSPEGMEEDIAHLSAGFAAVMQTYKAGEARLAALADDTKAPADDDDFERELELKICSPRWKAVIEDGVSEAEEAMKAREEDIAQRQRDAQDFAGFVEEQVRSARLQRALDLAAQRDDGLNDEDRRYLDLAEQRDRGRDDDFDLGR